MEGVPADLRSSALCGEEVGSSAREGRRVRYADPLEQAEREPATSSSPPAVRVPEPGSHDQTATGAELAPSLSRRKSARSGEGTRHVRFQQEEPLPSRPLPQAAAAAAPAATAAAAREAALLHDMALHPPEIFNSPFAIVFALIMSFILLVLPALLPALPAPPMELLLLPVVIMVLLLLVARSPDGAWEPPRGRENPHPT